MKIRNGFVSNSSSSSFVLIVHPNDHKKAMEQFSGHESKFLNALVSWRKVLGEWARVFSGEFSTENACIDINKLFMMWEGDFYKKHPEFQMCFDEMRTCFQNYRRYVTKIAKFKPFYDEKDY